MVHRRMDFFGRISYEHFEATPSKYTEYHSLIIHPEVSMHWYY